MSYAAPVRDIRFALEEVVAIDGLKATGAFEDLSRELVADVLREAAKLADETLAPLNTVGDKHGCRLENGVVTTAPGFKDAYARYVEGGWQGLSFPAEWGGANLPRALALAVSEMVQAANMSFGLAPMLTLGAIEALLAHGDEELKRLYLPKLVTGAWTGTMNLTEPQAGSDVGALTTKAWPAGDGAYRLQGGKIFITWGEHDCAENIVHLVLARLPDAPEGTRGLTLFLAPKFLVKADGSLGARNDLRCVGVEHKLGIHASPTCSMAYGESEGAIAYLIGGENAGMRCMFTMMNAARVHVGMQGAAIAERAFQQGLAFARERRQGRAPDGTYPAAIINHPDIRGMLVSMKARIEAGRAICYAAAMAGDAANHDPDPEERAWAKRREDLLTPIAKAWCTELGCEAASLNIQIHGGMGYVEETGAAQHYRDARIAPIYEGTNGIQAIDLTGRKIAADRGQALAELLEDMRETSEDMQLSSNPDLPPIGRRLAEAADALERAGVWVRDAAVEDRLAGSTPFLELAGDVTAGWLLGVGAVAAQRMLKGHEGDDAYAQSKIDLARYYAETALATAPGRSEAIGAGAEALLDIDEAMLG